MSNLKELNLAKTKSPDGTFTGIDSRDLYSRLGLTLRFNAWRSSQINKYALVEGRDFIKVKEAEKGEKSSRSSIRYLFAEDVANKIVMLSRGAKPALPVLATSVTWEKMETSIEVVLPVLDSIFGEKRAPSVDARKLFESLGVKKDFTDWIKVQIRRGQFVENRDFVIFNLQGEKPSGGRPSSEYSLSVDKAKHVAMMSNCRLGFVVRDYLIKIEERYWELKEEKLKGLGTRYPNQDVVKDHYNFPRREIRHGEGTLDGSTHPDRLYSVRLYSVFPKIKRMGYNWNSSLQRSMCKWNVCGG